MDMKVNPNLIKAERRRRAWSQQYLAEASGLGLRTIHRIERTGNASFESAKALAATLEVSVDDLQQVEGSGSHPTSLIGSRSIAAGALFAAFVAGAALFNASSVLADRVLLDIGVTKDTEATTSTYKTQVLMEDGSDIELPMEGKFNLVVTPKLLDDGNVIVSLKLYEYDDGEYKFVREPRVLAEAGIESEVRIGPGGGSDSSYRFAVTARPQ